MNDLTSDKIKFMASCTGAVLLSAVLGSAITVKVQGLSTVNQPVKTHTNEVGYQLHRSSDLMKHVAYIVSYLKGETLHHKVAIESLKEARVIVFELGPFLENNKFKNAQSIIKELEVAIMVKRSQGDPNLIQPVINKIDSLESPLGI
ncbi:TPA: hypothetical protein N2898_004598 [Vibrio parahaemolyticus]|uniref:hypothetical protein n=1 Tax=Vibrio parahaemolyticus TaxID=670 RepID=UPI00111EC20F|nr:hypothetical protein [Vibrio parahaemolyticus]TOI26674.1 hypothetical protein CGI63_23445 [Vibrio parahaemolyticus]HCG8549713.1 hypothetical protein [Vibrio parahaemolyticus]HCH0770772.1 hypothetical protein [Vibrio parahaemolyticus]HCH1007558.1 hypothetical protein [Vibrio parahaemolyticus]HCM1290482.1 hypothetical protein [Vibrio parahaemolyticus]